MKPYGIHWFRRDLRIAGNPALKWNFKKNEGRVLGVFFFDATFLSRPDFSHHRFAFFLKTLASLQNEMRMLGGDLLFLDAIPERGFKELLRSLEAPPSVVTFNRDYEPFARKRDREVRALLASDLSIRVHTERDHLVIEPNELSKKEEGSYYQVYTPFARRWFDLLATPAIQERIDSQKTGLKFLKSLASGKAMEPIFSLRWENVFKKSGGLPDQLQKVVGQNSKHIQIEIPEAGSKAAFAQLDIFSKKIENYLERRDIPSVEGTSRLSVFFKNGSLTPAQAIAYLQLKNERLKTQDGPTQFLKELVWREFYYHILFHCPRVEHEAFLTQYQNLKWENREDYFEAWKAGKTGYPIVDAGMRELKETGWMHNRVRMIVASFLTKDLLIDWRWGEKYFMETLLDGDLAPNNGGWQWAASTGCDPQPYFRVFNPTLQSERFDPEGIYLKRYLPERSKLVGKDLHAPIRPIVAHSERKTLAISLYRNARSES